MLRLLMCNPEGNRRGCGGPAFLPDGSPYVLGTPPRHFPYRYKCSNCKLTSTITAREWHQLPRLALVDLRTLPGPGGRGEIDLSHIVTRDLIGAGLTPAQVEQAAAAVGVDLHLLAGHPSRQHPSE